MSISRRTRAAITTGLTLASGAGAYELQVQVSTAHSWVKVLETAGGVLLTVLTGAIPTYEQYRQVRERRAAEKLASDAVERLRVTIGDVLEPLTGLLGQVNKATGPAKKELKGAGIQLVVNAAMGLPAKERVRACFFRAEPGPPRRLRPDKFNGRSGRPRHTFEAGTVEGNAALAMVDDGGRRYCADVRESPPPGWAGTTSGYRTFVSVAVKAGNEGFGMLTVDALTPGDLASQEEVGLVDALAHVLAAILSA